MNRAARSSCLVDRRSFLAACAALPWLRFDRRGLGTAGSERSLIVLWMDGGMSHVDLFDGKPEAPPDIRGDLRSIACDRYGLEGVFVSERLERVAPLLRRCTLIRSVTSGEGNHDRGSHYVLTGHRPSPVLVHPAIGSWLGEIRPVRDGAVPDYVAVPEAPDYGRSGFLGATRRPFEPGGEPQRADFRVRDLEPPAERRRALDLLREQDALDGRPRSASEVARDRFLEQARRLAEDPAARAAFDLSQERPERRSRYGRHRFGQSCLLARRLVAAGSRTVLVRDRGWDHHQNIRQALTYGFPPKLDALDESLSALLEDLSESGLAERVVVLLASEFGRTPRLNPAGGRDHWPRAFSVLLFGAGIARGAVVGQTDRRGEEPVERPVSPADLHATIAAALGVDGTPVLRTSDGRPIPVFARGAAPIAEALER